MELYASVTPGKRVLHFFYSRERYEWWGTHHARGSSLQCNELHTKAITKIHQNSSKINENQCKINEIQWNSMKINDLPWSVLTLEVSVHWLERPPPALCDTHHCISLPGVKEAKHMLSRGHWRIKIYSVATKLWKHQNIKIFMILPFFDTIFIMKK